MTMPSFVTMHMERMSKSIETPQIVKDIPTRKRVYTFLSKIWTMMHQNIARIILGSCIMRMAMCMFDYMM